MQEEEDELQGLASKKEEPKEEKKEEEQPPLRRSARLKNLSRSLDEKSAIPQPSPLSQRGLASALILESVANLAAERARKERKTKRSTAQWTDVIFLPPPEEVKWENLLP